MQVALEYYQCSPHLLIPGTASVERARTPYARTSAKEDRASKASASSRDTDCEAIVKPAPKPMVRVSVQREPREGHSGYFFKEVFWNLPINERNGKMMRVCADAALRNEWDTIVESMRAPREVLPPQKAVAIERPAIRERSEVFAMGQPQSVDEMRKAFLPTMQNGNGGISPDLDRRGWMPDCKPKELTPSR
jgi:hypothetical protein